MESRQISPNAVVTFSGARQANRRIAGVAAVARIVRELAEAKFVTAWIDVPAGDAIDAAAMDDVHRLAGAMTIRIGQPALGEPVCRLPGDRLILARAIPDFLAERPIPTGTTVDLDEPGTTAEILRWTGKDSDGPVSRWFNRPISRRISAVLLRNPGFGPAHATAGTGLLALLMFAALVAGGPTGLIVGGLLFHAASVFDGVDGEVARATFRASRIGSMLDNVVDVAASALFVVGLAVNLVRQGHGEAGALAAWGLSLLLLGLGALAWRAASSEGAFSLNYLKHHVRGRFAGSLVAGFFSLATIITSRDFFCLASALLIVFGLPMVILYGLAVVAPVWIVFVASTFLPGGNAALARENS